MSYVAIRIEWALKPRDIVALVAFERSHYDKAFPTSKAETNVSGHTTRPSATRCAITCRAKARSTRRTPSIVFFASFQNGSATCVTSDEQHVDHDEGALRDQRREGLEADADA